MERWIESKANTVFPSSLFRPEALAHADRNAVWTGLEPPSKSQSSIAMAACAALLLSLVGACLLPYNEWVDAPGEIVMHSGQSDVRTLRPATVLAVVKPSGARVRRGDVLALLKPLDTETSDELTTDRTRAALLEQIALVEQAQRDVRLKGEAERSNAYDSTAEAIGLSASSVAAVQAQEEIIRRAKEKLASKQALMAKGYVSRTDGADAARDVALEEQRLLDLQSRRMQNDTEARRQQRLAMSSSAAMRLEESRLQEERAQLRDQLQRLSATQVQPLRANGDGTLADLRVKRGQLLPAGYLVASVVPTDGSLDAEFQVDAKVASMVKEGDAVKLNIAPFPHQQFGWVKGKIKTVDFSASEQSQTGVEPKGTGRLSYRLVARVLPFSIRAYGKTIPLRPGTPVTAGFKIRRQSVARWLIEPLTSSIWTHG